MTTRSLFFCLMLLALGGFSSCKFGGGGQVECKRACEACLGKPTRIGTKQPRHDKRNLPACIETCKEKGTTSVFAYCSSNKPTRDQCEHACDHYTDVIKAKQQRKGTADDLVFGNTYGDKKKCVRTCVKYGTQETLRCIYRAQLPTQAQRCMR